MSEKREQRMSIITERQKDGNDIIMESQKTREGVVATIRLPKAIVASIDEWVEQEMFRSRSDFLATAARHYLLYLADKDIRPPNLKRD